MIQETDLWEIVLPAWYLEDNQLKVHEWSENIRKYVQGIKILHMYEAGNLNGEDSNIVKIAASRYHIIEILKLTQEQYEIDQIMAYRIASSCFIFEKEEKSVLDLVKMGIQNPDGSLTDNYK